MNIVDGIYYILLADLVGSTKFAAAWGNAALTNRINTFVEAAKKALENAKRTGNSGYFVKSVGDGVLIAFNHFPDIIQWDAEFRGLLILAGAKQERLQARVCVHAGELRFEAGDTLNLATNQVSKIEKHVGPGEVVLSDIAYKLALPSLYPLQCEFVDHGVIEVEGQGGPVKLHRLFVKQEIAFLIDKQSRSRNSTRSAAPEAQFSDQAISILTQVVQSGRADFFHADWGGGQWSLQFCHGDQKQIQVTEPQFLKDDLGDLVSAGLLSVEINPDGHGIYSLKRNAARFVEALPKDKRAAQE